MLLTLVILWIFGAVLTAKADAILAKQPTVTILWLSLLIWPVVAMYIIFTKHQVCHDGDSWYDL